MGESGRVRRAEDGRGAPGAAEAIVALANSQHGIVSRRQLLSAGVGPDAIDSRLRNGLLVPVHRGVFALVPGVRSRQGRWLAAVLAAGANAVLSHADAAAAWGLIAGAGGPVDVTLGGRSGRRRRAGIRIHRSRLSAADRAVHGGLPLTAPARTLVDLAYIGSARQLEEAVEGAFVRRLVTPQSLDRAVLRNAGRAGVPRLRRLLAGPAPRTRSHLERSFVALCARAGLPAPRVNEQVGGYEVDFLWPIERLVVETDGYAAHSSPSAFERDRTRSLHLRALGYEVLRFSYRQVTRSTDAVVADLCAALDRGASTADGAAKTPRSRGDGRR